MLNDLRHVRSASGLASLLGGLLLAVIVLAAFDNPSTSHPVVTQAKPAARRVGRTRPQPRTKSKSAHQSGRATHQSSLRYGSLKQMVGQTVMAGMNGPLPDADLLARVRAGQIGV